MQKIFPKKLKAGDEIRVIAPSSSAKTIDAPIRKLADKRWKEMGFNISFSKHAFEKDILDSSSLASRVADFNAAFRDKNVKGISCARGGFNANTLLTYIDWNLVKKNPKPLWGYSDITVLANAIYAKTGIVSYIGPNFTTFGRKEEINYVLEYFEKCLMNDAAFEVGVSKTFGERKPPFRKNQGLKVLREGTATGTIIGGHLSTLNLLQGTEFMPSLKDTVLFIESDNFGGELGPLEFERDLQSLLHLPDAIGIKGIVFGKFQKDSKMSAEKLQLIVATKKELKNIPIITDANFGHTMPIFTFPIGGTVRIEAKGKRAKITILKH